MTDEEANEIAGHVWGEHCKSDDGRRLFRDMVLAGHRAGLEEAVSQLDKHIILRGNDQWQERLALLGFKDWLDAKLKEQS